MAKLALGIELVHVEVSLAGDTTVLGDGNIAVGNFCWFAFVVLQDKPGVA